ncbi:MAG: GNAT family N-acetyltransferase [Candidatus Aenigmatarchaeota archaeon]
MEDYPKEVRLKDGKKVKIRLMSGEDREEFRRFFLGLSEQDRMFLKEDFSSEEALNELIHSISTGSIQPIVAESEGKIVGYALLNRYKFSWLRHVGEIRIAVAKAYRKRGLGTYLAKEVFHTALKEGLQKILAEMMADQVDAIRMFEKLGFQKEAILKDHVIDLKNTSHDLLIMSQHLDILWRKVEDMIIAEEQRSQD